MKKESGRKLRLEINGVERELPEKLIEMIERNHSRISNVYEPVTSLNQTKNHASLVTESLSLLYSGMRDFVIKSDYSMIQAICNHPMAMSLYNLMVPSIGVKAKTLTVPYVAVKLAYVCHLISIIGTVDKNKQVIVITRNHNDALMLEEAMSELKLAFRVSTEKQGFCLDTQALNNYPDMVESTDIYYNDQPGLAEAYKVLNMNLIFIDCTRNKEVRVFTPGYVFYNGVEIAGYASIDAEPEYIFGYGKAANIDNPIVRVIDTISNIKGAKGDRKNLFTYFVNMKYENYKEMKESMENDYNIDFYSQWAREFDDKFYNSGSNYKEATTKMVYEMAHPILFINGDGLITYAAPKAYPNQYIFEEVKSVEECFKERLEKYYKDLQQQELNPETIDLLYKVNSLLKEV